MAGLLALALAFVSSALPAAATDAAAAAKPTTLAAAASTAVARMSIPTAALAQAAPAPRTSPAVDTGSKSFFKTGPGKLAIVLMLGGTGFMVYSAFKDNDPVHSQFR